MKRALVLYAGSEFKGASNTAVRYLEGQGFSCQSQDVGASHEPTQLWIDEYPKTMIRVDATVWLSHGGWDGPMMFGGTRHDFLISPQIGRNYSNMAWPAVCNWFKNMLTQNGIAVIHACHSAGSNQYEPTDGTTAQRWVEDLAADANIYTVGVEGSTSSAVSSQVLALLKHAFHGSSPPQATRVYEPGGRRVARWGGWLKVVRR